MKILKFSGGFFPTDIHVFDPGEKRASAEFLQIMIEGSSSPFGDDFHSAIESIPDPSRKPPARSLASGEPTKRNTLDGSYNEGVKTGYHASIF